MAVQEKILWKTWADTLRQEMMGGLMSEVTKSVDEIASEVATSKSAATLRSERFWRSCQAGRRPNDFFTAAGFDLEFQTVEGRQVEEVTLRLNATWMAILQRVLDRQGG